MANCYYKGKEGRSRSDRDREVKLSYTHTVTLKHTDINFRVTDSVAKRYQEQQQLIYQQILRLPLHFYEIMGLCSDKDAIIRLIITFVHNSSWFGLMGANTTPPFLNNAPFPFLKVYASLQGAQDSFRLLERVSRCARSFPFTSIICITCSNKPFKETQKKKPLHANQLVHF